MKFQGRKRCKTVNHLMICDNSHNIIAISDGIGGNHHDSFELIEQVDKLVECMNAADIDYKNSHLNADTGFDVQDFIEHVESEHKMIANIPNNKRNRKKIEKKTRYLNEYIYSFRFKIEVVFAWLDTYKRVLVRFEYLDSNFKSWLLLAATLINLRNIFN